jgi:hypothetical protein
MMTFEKYTRLKPKPEHIDGVMAVLTTNSLVSPIQIMKLSNLSLTAVNCTLGYLEKLGSLDVVHQTKSPKVQVSLKALPQTLETSDSDE